MATRDLDHWAADRLVPTVVAEKISNVVNRTRGTRLVSGAIISLAAAGVVLLAAIGIDWALVLFEPAQRTQLTFASLITIASLSVICLGMMAFRRVSKLEAARQIDEQLPQLQERWTSVTEFSSTQAAPELRGSETFIRRVAEEAAQLEHIVLPQQIRMGKELNLALAGLGAVAGLWTIALLIDPGHVTVLVRRFLAPQSVISLTQINAESGDVVQPRGSNLKLEATVAGRLQTKAEISIRRESGNEEIVALDALNGDPTRFAFPIKNLQTSFAYRFRSGDGQTAWHTVRMAERPSMKMVDFQITPPAYSRLPELHQDGLPKSIKALQGSRLILQIEPSIPLSSLVLRQDNKADISLAASDSNQYCWELVLDETFAFTPILISQDGLQNLQPPRCEIVVFRDQAPTVDVATPTNEVAVRPDDSVTISFDAKDDLGISKAELVIFDASKEGAEELKTIPIPLGDQTGEKSIHAQTELNLQDFNLKHGEQLTYAIRVYDTKDKATTQQPGDSTTTPSEPAKVEQPDQANSPQKNVADSRPSNDQKNDPALASNSQSPSDDSPESPDEAPNSRQQAQAARAAKPPQNDDKSEFSEDKPESEDPRQQAGGGNQWVPDSTKDSPPNEEPKGEVNGKPRPDFLMSKRELDTPAGQCTSCSRRKITIDEWAGSFASQVLDKLQIEIDPVLKELKKTLGQARDTLQPVADRATALPDWKPADSVPVRKGDGFLELSEKQVKELTTKTNETPYAFIGLQLQDISQLHIQPARSHLQGVTLLDAPCKPEDLTASLVHIQRAIELLEKLTREYEAVKLNQKLAETMTRIQKMHQMFLEGTFAMLTAQKPNLNPKERAFMELELTDEFLAKLQELLKKKLEIQAELAKLLSQDPRLLERFMARSRLEATTLRDQLTLLNGRQRELLSETTEGLPPADQPEGKFELKNRLLKRAELAAQIAEETSQLLDNYVVWTPLEMDVNQGDLAVFKAKGVKLVATASELAKQSRNKDNRQALETGEALYEQLLEWERTLPDLLNNNLDPKMPTHIANRLQDTEKLITEVSGWIVKEQAMESGEDHLAAEVDQHRITVDTMTLSRKLTSLNAQCQGISVELAELASNFLKTMEEDLIPELEESQISLNGNEIPDAVKHQTVAIEQFSTAEKQLDEVMDGIIKHLDSLAFNPKPELPDDLQPPPLEDLLAMLDDEARAAEALGIPCCRPSNLVIEKDWFKPGSNPGSGGGKGSGSGRRSLQPNAQMAQSKQAGQQAEKLRKQFEGSVRKQMTAKSGADKNGVANKPERKWDTLGSKLEDHLRQGRGNLPPEQYRKAIELYFESLAGKSNGGPKGD